MHATAVSADCPFAQLGREVPLNDIESSLKELWDNATSSTKASLINFVVFSDSPENLVESMRDVAHITRQNACRAILIGVDRRAKPDANVRAWITMHCNVSNGDKSICSEQIALLMPGDSARALRNIIFTHLLSDLPLVLWWHGKLTKTFGPDLYSRIDRLIIDSCSWGDDLKTQYQRLKTAMDSKEANLSAHDIAWTRTYHFRLATAMQFDHPSTLDKLPSLQKLAVTGHPDTLSSLLLYIAWVASKLNWKPQSQTPTKKGLQWLFTDKKNGSPEVLLHLAPSSAPIGKVTFHLNDATISLTRQANEHHIYSCGSFSGGKAEALSPAESDQPGNLVADQLSRGGKNSLYRDTLNTFFDMLELMD